MDRRDVAALFAAVVAASLVAAPVTMADWGEQALVSAEPIEPSQMVEETPVLAYEDLSADARDAVRQAIESPGGTHTVYGEEEWPDQFTYSDYTAPGRGLYVVVYEDQHYQLTTRAVGGFPSVYWLFELPFVVYGLALGWLAVRTYRGEGAPGFAAAAAVAGVAFHLLGPEFGFPVVSSLQFSGLGALAAAAVGVGLLLDADRGTRAGTPD